MVENGGGANEIFFSWRLKVFLSEEETSSKRFFEKEIFSLEEEK